MLAGVEVAHQPVDPGRVVGAHFHLSGATRPEQLAPLPRAIARAPARQVLTERLEEQDVLASDRPLVANSEGEVWSVSPYTGKLLGRVDVPGPVRIGPAVAEETVILLTDDADLIALR